MNWNAIRDGADSPKTTLWLADALDAPDARSVERYLCRIEQKLEHGDVARALEMSATLPEICSMLEHPQLRTSPAHCVCWCDAWVAMDSDSENVFPLTRIYLRDYLREENADLTQWISEDAQFAHSVCTSLLNAARSWYRQRGAYDLTVQYNLGKVAGN
jgi:hypothetical protein